MTERLYRSDSERLVGGVCSGLADYFAVRPTFLRLVFLLWALASTTGAIIYVTLWTVLPEKSTQSHSLDERIRRNVDDMQAQAERLHRDLQDMLGATDSPEPGQIQRAMIVGSALTGLGIVLLIDSLHLLGPFRLRQLEPLALTLIGIVFVRRAL